jgi:hypothetical protein
LLAETFCRLSKESIVNEREAVLAAANALAAAIGRQDAGAIKAVLTHDFVLRTPGGSSLSADAFVAQVRSITAEIDFVRLEQVQVDLKPGSALVSGVQHARVRIEGQVVDEYKAFADWFIETEHGWKVRVALDLPAIAAE